MDKNHLAERGEFEHQQKQLENVYNFLMTMLTGSVGGRLGIMPGSLLAWVPIHLRTHH